MRKSTIKRSLGVHGFVDLITREAGHCSRQDITRDRHLSPRMKLTIGYSAELEKKTYDIITLN